MISGFVKLQREIVNKDWFKDANAVQLYSLLLASANFADNGIKRGQCKFSLPALQTALNKSKKEVRNAIDKLEKAGEISVKTTKGRCGFSLITMLKYDETQGALLEAQNGAQKRAHFQPSQITDNCQVINENIKGGALLEAQNGALLGADLIYNKKYIEESNNNISSTPSKEGETKFFNELSRTDTEFFSLVCMRLNIDSIIYSKLLTDFKTECAMREKFHLSVSDIKKHFVDWARGEIERTNKTKIKTNESDKNRRRATEARIKSVAEFEADF